MAEDEEMRNLARKLGQHNGLKDGNARAAKLTPEQGSATAKKAAQARWAKKRQQEE